MGNIVFREHGKLLQNMFAGNCGWLEIKLFLKTSSSPHVP
jgi:hypothetical protein